MIFFGFDGISLLAGLLITLVVLLPFVVQRNREAKKEKFEKRDW